jgi:hypothetical protein
MKCRNKGTTTVEWNTVKRKEMTVEESFKCVRFMGGRRNQHAEGQDTLTILSGLLHLWIDVFEAYQ